MSGLVDAPYSVVSETTEGEIGNQNSVRDRLYRGWCRSDEVTQYVRKEFIAKEKTAGSRDYFLRCRIRPGSNGREGGAEFETKLPAPYTSGSRSYELPGFSNDKKINRINVMIKKKAETLELYIDKKLIAAFNNAIPADIQFNALSFSHGRSDSETEKYFISNIKIAKDQ